MDTGRFDGMTDIANGNGVVCRLPLRKQARECFHAEFGGGSRRLCAQGTRRRKRHAMLANSRECGFTSIRAIQHALVVNIIVVGINMSKIVPIHTG